MSQIGMFYLPFSTDKAVANIQTFYHNSPCSSLRVPKIEDKWSQSSEKNILGRDAWSIVCGCNNRQRVGVSSPAIEFFERNIWIYAPVFSSSDANLSWRTRLNTVCVCQFAFHTEHRSTKCHKQDKHRCNIVWLYKTVANTNLIFHQILFYYCR